ncbi:MAG: DMT family transporter [Actinomycetota bacterium]|nr:DMT family transporter [Actinomycetota bacterium]
MPAPRPAAVDVALMAVGVVGVSMSGPLMAAMAAPALAVAFWRNALGTAAILPVAALGHRAAMRRLTFGELRLIGVAALALAVHFATWVSSLRLTSVAAATALVSLQAGWVVLLAWARGERPSAGVGVGLALCLLGVVVVTGVDVTVSAEALLGDVLALVGGVAAAVYVLVGGTVRQRTDTTVYTLLCYGTCAVVLLAACVVSGSALGGYDAADWWRLLGVTVAAQLLGHSVFNHLLDTVSPTVVSLVILLEVPGAALLAGWFLGQSPQWGIYVGLVLLLAGLAVVVAVRRETPAETVPD